MVNLKVLRYIKDIHIVKHVMFDYGCQSASGANARFEIMMRRWRHLAENGVGDVSFALYVLFFLLFSFSRIRILINIFCSCRPAMNLLKILPSSRGMISLSVNGVLVSC